LTIYDKISNFALQTWGKILDLFGIAHDFNVRLDRFTKHLEAIKRLNVIKDYTLSIKETRGYVMLILKRINDMGIEKIRNM
jgi:transcription-repair coupling factor (superfamily II helicase)